MKLINVIVWIFLLLAFPARSEEVETFINKLNKEYSSLLLHVPKSEQNAWNQRNYEIMEKVSEEISSHKQTVEYFKRKGTYEKYKDTLPFSFLKKTQYIRLDLQTDLVNELGEYVYKEYYDKEINILLLAIESELLGFQNKQGALQLQSKLTQYLSLKRKIDESVNNPIVLTELGYRPASSAWDTDPQLMKKFVLYDWEKSMKVLSGYREELNNINDSFVSFNKLRLQDPAGYISFGSQIAVLLITVAGYMISYTEKPSLAVISFLVLSSMGLSFVMISVSSSTLFNIVIQAMLPAAFIIYWTIKGYAKKRHQVV